jgi:hypothetical protein
MDELDLEDPKFTGIHDMSEASEGDGTIGEDLIAGLGVETLGYADAEESEGNWNALTAIPDAKITPEPAPAAGGHALT